MLARSLAVVFAVAAASAAVAFARAPARIVVAAGDDLQAAIDRARGGDEILVEAGATFVGNFRLRARPGTAYITIRSSAVPPRLPAGGRVGPQHADWMPVLRSPNTRPVLSADPGAHHWRVQWLAFEATAGGAGEIIALGDGGDDQRDRSAIPHDLLLEGLLLRGDPARGQKRGIALNSAATVVRNCDIRDIKAAGQDSQAIAGWNGPGPFLIENNYLEAAGENLLFGGADPAVPALVPADITVRGNYVTKPLGWRSPGSPWTVKNLFELKNARRVLVEWNVFEHNWEAGQTGYAVLFTPRNQDGRAPWTVVEDVVFRYNIVRHAAGGINVLGRDNEHPSQQTRRIEIAGNLFHDIDAARWGGTGVFLLIGDAPADVSVDRNTIVQSGSVVLAHGRIGGRPAPILGFRFTNNVAFHNEYGIIGEDHGIGSHTIEAYFPDADISRNVLAGGDPQRYPPGNFFPRPAELLAEFVDPSANDYRLRPGSRYRSLGSDGGPLGSDVEALRDGTPDRTGWRRAQPRGGDR
ncbi:MAG TPA: hypothetical protein VNI83_02810 [Vicinamibacterales bacterium]|nr:hypothetical protein [Vicinamibacterales bacterium]